MLITHHLNLMVLESLWLFLVTVHTETKEHVASFLTLDRYEKSKYYIMNRPKGSMANRFRAWESIYKSALVINIDVLNGFALFRDDGNIDDSTFYKRNQRWI